ncbi:MAG: prepilin peptidase [Lachnospiraceae bacterium]|nr:prepilin peptidase [Lachnospiraceae bacterium]
MKDVLLLSFLLAASVSDLKYRKIDNALILSGILAFSLLLFFTGGPAALLSGYCYTVLVFVLLFPCFALGFLGAGDIKFLMVLILAVGAGELRDALQFILPAALLTAALSKKRQFPAAVPVSLGILASAAFH